MKTESINFIIRFQAYLKILIGILSFFILAVFFSGGFAVTTLWGKIRCWTVMNPILMQSALFLFWISLSPKIFDTLRSFFSIRNLLAWLGMLFGSLGLALWIWDLYHPGLIWGTLFGKNLTHGQEAFLENSVWFWAWFIQLLWLFLSYLHSRSGKFPLSFSLGKVVRVLSFLIFSFAFINFDAWGIVRDYRFITFSFFLGMIGLGIGWTWPIREVSKDHVRKSRFEIRLDSNGIDEQPASSHPSGTAAFNSNKEAGSGTGARVLAKKRTHGRRNSTHWCQSMELLYLWLGIILFFIVFLILSQARYSMFRVYEDFPQSAQALWSTLNGKFMNITFWVFDGEGRSFFAQHFQPLMLLFVPLYAVISDPRFLLGIHVLGTALAALPLYGIARGRLKNPWLALAFTFAYLHSPLIQRGTLHDFHLENFVPLLFFLTFYLLQKGKVLWHCVMGLLLLSVREDCFIYVLLMGFYAIIFEKKRKAGWADLILGLSWIIISLGWIVPSLKDQNSHIFAQRYMYFEADGLFGLLWGIITNPHHVYNLLIGSDAGFSMLFLSVPLLFLPWLSLRGLLFIIPLNLIFFLSSFLPLRILAAFYSFLIVPCYLLGAILTTETFLNRIRLNQTLYRKVSSGLTVFLFVATLVFNFFFVPSNTAKHGPLDRDVVESSPLGREFHVNYYLGSSHQRIGREVIRELIPEGASLSTEMGFATHLSNRFILRVFPNYQGVEYIFLDLLSDPIKTVFRWDQRLIGNLLMKSDYGVVTYRDGWLLLKKGFSKKRNSGVLHQIFRSYGVLKFKHRTGSFQPDPDANFHLALRADSKKDSPGFMIFGRYWDLPEGRYRVIFRLKSTRNDVKENIAQLSMTANRNGQRIVVFEKLIRGTDFYLNHCYQDFVLDLDTRGLQGIEFRVAFLGYGDLWFEGLDLWAPRIPVDQIYRFMMA